MNELDMRIMNRIKENYGHLITLDSYSKKDSRIEVMLKYSAPHLITDDENEKRSIEFIELPKVGRLLLNSKDLTVIGADKRTKVIEQIKEEKKNLVLKVESFLVKLVPESFARLPFPQHRFAPVMDILTTMIKTNEFSLSDIPKGDKQKYITYLKGMASCELLREDNNRFFIGNVLIELLERLKQDNVIIEAFGYYIKNGKYQESDVEGIMGIYSDISAVYYFEAMKNGRLTSFSTKSLYEQYFDYFRKTCHIPRFERYLFQLYNVGIMGKKKEFWYGIPTIFNKVVQNFPASLG
jgi:hypothetical protein